MILQYISKIKIRASIYASKKTGNVLDGSYRSVYKGTSQNFEDLREYIPGDNVRDIDWKASSRNRNLLVRQYVAEKKHNIMVVFDSGIKMSGHTETGDSKKDVAIMAGGMFAYMAAKNGDNVGAIYNNGDMLSFYQVKQGLYNVERILTSYSKECEKKTSSNLERVLDYVVRNIKRRMVILVVTDMSGINSVSEVVLKKLIFQHDVMFINVGDARITEKDAYSAVQENYLPEFFTGSKWLRKKEDEKRNQILQENSKKLKGMGIMCTTIQNDEDVPEKLNELLERHKIEKTR